MKNIFLLFVLLTSIITTTFSQDYRKIEWDIVGISRLAPTASDIGTAVGFYTELRLNLNNRISLGLNYNWQFFGELFDEPIRSAGITTSYAIGGDYYVFNNGNRRAFAGLGFGLFNNAATTESGIDVGGSGLGIIPRIGYKFGLLRITTSYNYTFENDFPDYFAFGLGLSIGGRHISLTNK